MAQVQGRAARDHSGCVRALQDPAGTAASDATHVEIRRLRREYRFFHWHLEFPEVFTVPEGDGAGAGVDVDVDVDPATGWAGWARV
ncbi:hypothetical protein GCM10009753_55090 [Streptantibioticus ferralitis]